MNTTTQLTAIAGIAIVATLIASPWVFAAVTPVTTATTVTSSTYSTSGTGSLKSSISTNCHEPGFLGEPKHGGMPGPEAGLAIRNHSTNLTVGQSIIITSSTGKYFEVGTPNTNGTASGDIAFQVDSRLVGGYTLSISGGSIVVAGTTYTINSGSAQIGQFADVLSGEGTTTPAGQFLLQGFARGTFAGTTGLILLDLKSASTEYVISLVGSVRG